MTAPGPHPAVLVTLTGHVPGTNSEPGPDAASVTFDDDTVAAVGQWLSAPICGAVDGPWKCHRDAGHIGVHEDCDDWGTLRHWTAAL